MTLMGRGEVRRDFWWGKAVGKGPLEKAKCRCTLSK
jgi:hypothetical protein